MPVAHRSSSPVSKSPFSSTAGAGRRLAGGVFSSVRWAAPPPRLRRQPAGVATFCRRREGGGDGEARGGFEERERIHGRERGEGRARGARSGRSLPRPPEPADLHRLRPSPGPLAAPCRSRGWPIGARARWYRYARRVPSPGTADRRRPARTGSRHRTPELPLYRRRSDTTRGAYRHRRRSDTTRGAYRHRRRSSDSTAEVGHTARRTLVQTPPTEL